MLMLTLHSSVLLFSPNRKVQKIKHLHFISRHIWRKHNSFGAKQGTVLWPPCAGSLPVVTSLWKPDVGQRPPLQKRPSEPPKENRGFGPT